MHNWKKIDDTWTRFSVYNNLKIVKTDKSYFHGKISEYTVRFTDHVEIIGHLNMNNQGYNRSWTKIKITNFISDQPDFNLTHKNGLFGFFKRSDKINPFEKLLSEFGLSRITKDKDLIIFKYDFIFQDTRDFSSLFDPLVLMLRKASR